MSTVVSRKFCPMNMGVFSLASSNYMCDKHREDRCRRCMARLGRRVLDASVVGMFRILFSGYEMCSVRNRTQKLFFSAIMCH